MWRPTLHVMPMRSFDWLQWARTGERQDMYPSPEHRVNEIEAGCCDGPVWTSRSIWIPPLDV